jgi:hypothetical protein
MVVSGQSTDDRRLQPRPVASTTLMRDISSHAVAEDEASDKNQTDRDADDHWIEQPTVHKRNDLRGMISIR